MPLRAAHGMEQLYPAAPLVGGNAIALACQRKPKTMNRAGEAAAIHRSAS